MTPQEAIEIITNAIQTDDMTPEQDKALAIVQRATAKQIPMKPVGQHTNYRCPICGTRVRSGKGSSCRTKDTVCRKCFRVLDWSDEV